jgi:hypothetical protein
VIRNQFSRREEIGGVMTIVCFYCGHASDSMQEAARHDADRPESCLQWQQLGKPPMGGTAEQILQALRSLIVQGGGSLDRELDVHYERLQRVYR